MLYKNKYIEIFKSIFVFFNENIFAIPEFSFENIYYTDNMKEDVFLFCTPKEFEKPENDGGVTLVPDDNLKQIVVIIDLSSDNVLIYARNLIHELIHVYDFIIFSKHYYSNPFETISKHIFFEAYRYWSEFRAYALGEYYSYKYMDIMEESNHIHNMMKKIESNFESFLATKRQMVLDHNFEEYDLAMMFGYIYLFEYYHNVTSFRNSYVHKYLPLVFRSNLKYDLLHLYELYFDSCHSHDIFLNLSEIKNIVDRVIQEDKH